jgi:hypothetical protein
MTKSITTFLLIFLIGLSDQLWSEDWSYRLHEGENLTLVADRFLKKEITPEQLQLYNGIANDREIPIGAEIRVPIEWLKELLAGVNVRFVRGEAFLQRMGLEETTNLVAGTMLSAGDRVITGVASSVSLRFADDSRLLIGEESEVVFDTLSSFKGMGMLDTRIRLQRGRVENRIKPVRKPEYRYEIYTPAAVTVVRGTDFRVYSHAENDLTRAEVTKGGVEISAAGETVLVGQGEGSRIVKGDPPTPPRKLLAKPDLTAMVYRDTVDGLEIEWPSLDGAMAYRYRLEDSEERAIAGGKVEENSLLLRHLPDGNYQLKLRGIDDMGFEGLNAYGDFQLHPPQQEESGGLEAPVLFAPRFSNRGIHIHWNQVNGAWAYRLYLARDSALDDLLFTRLSEDRGFVLYPLPPGRYFIGVEALSANSDDRTRSNIYRITVPVWH